MNCVLKPDEGKVYKNAISSAADLPDLTPNEGHRPKGTTEF